MAETIKLLGWSRTSTFMKTTYFAVREYAVKHRVTRRASFTSVVSIKHGTHLSERRQGKSGKVSGSWTSGNNSVLHALHQQESFYDDNLVEKIRQAEID